MEQNLSPPCTDNRLVINEGELNLQRLAAIVVAIEVLPYDLSCSPTEAEKLADLYHISWWLEMHGWKIVEKLFAPKKIQDLLHDPVELISSEIDIWLRYHIPQVFIEWDQKRDDFVLKFIRHFVWTTFGTIDYEKTAEKLISDADLEISFQEKYRLACLNCLRDTVENLYNENSEMADAEIGFPLVFYWYYKLADVVFDLDKLSLAPPYVPIWSCFLKQMGEEERYLFSIGRMLKFPARVVKDLLPKFTEIEQRRLFEKKLPELMRLFVFEDYPQFAVQLWHHVNDTITAKMYIDVFEELRGIDVYFGNDSAPPWLGDLGIEMWLSASNNLKKNMFQYKNGDFLCEWTDWFNYEVHRNNLRNDTFLLKMLSEASPEYRKQFWMDHWNQLLFDCKSKYFAKLIKACLPKPGDVDEFLKKLANSSELRDHLKKLCQDLMFFEFIEFLDQFVRDTNLKADLKKLFVPSEDQLSERLKCRSMSEKNFKSLSALLIDVYGSEISIEYKANFIRSGFIQCISNQKLWGDCFILKWRAMESIGMAKYPSFFCNAKYLCDEEELQTVKQKILAEREFFEALAKQKENMIVWDDLLKWLVGGKQAMGGESI